MRHALLRGRRGEYDRVWKVLFTLLGYNRDELIELTEALIRHLIDTAPDA